MAVHFSTKMGRKSGKEKASPARARRPPRGATRRAAGRAPSPSPPPSPFRGARGRGARAGAAARAFAPRPAAPRERERAPAAAAAPPPPRAGTVRVLRRRGPRQPSGCTSRRQCLHQRPRARQLVRASACACAWLCVVCARERERATQSEREGRGKRRGRRWRRRPRPLRWCTRTASTSGIPQRAQLGNGSGGQTSPPLVRPCQPSVPTRASRQRSSCSSPSGRLPSRRPSRHGTTSGGSGYTRNNTRPRSARNSRTQRRGKCRIKARRRTRLVFIPTRSSKTKRTCTRAFPPNTLTRRSTTLPTSSCH